MTRMLLKKLGVVLFLTGALAAAAQPEIRSLDRNRVLQWTNAIAQPGALGVIERTDSLAAGEWTPFFFDTATNGLHVSRLPPGPGSNAFFRVAIRDNPPDPDLVMHLTFDNDFENGVVLDTSGHLNHGLRYGRPSAPTNWPSAMVGVDGGRAAEFHYYFDGYGTYGRSGDYIGIPWSRDFTNLPKATIAAWVRYYRSPNGDINNDHNSTIFDTGHYTKGAWKLGRAYADYTSFQVFVTPTDQVDLIRFPDSAPDGDTKDWHHYLVTYDQGKAIGYFDGVAVATNTVGSSPLSMGGYYIGVACWTFNATPELNLAVDLHPNNAWINGGVDDLRIYRRVLDAAEVRGLFRSFDVLAPTVPSNVRARAVASSMIDLRWDVSTDRFGVAGYRVYRDRQLLVDQAGTHLVDGGLAAATSYEYAVEAYDTGGKASALSAPIVVTTPAEGSPVEVVVDDADGAPWVTSTGNWVYTKFWPGYYGSGTLTDNKVKGGALTFTPQLPEAGNYAVYVQFPGSSSQAYQMSASVPIEVVHSGQTNKVVLNQKVGYGKWNLLGNFQFDAGTNGYVRIRNTGTDGLYVQGDAFRFVK